MVIIQLDSEQLFSLIENAVRKAIREQETQGDSIPTQRKILSLTEFCEYTGLSRQTVYKLTSGQKIPHSKKAKRLWFDREKVDAWLLENRVKTKAEIQQEVDEILTTQGKKRRA